MKILHVATMIAHSLLWMVGPSTHHIGHCPVIRHFRCFCFFFPFLVNSPCKNVLEQVSCAIHHHLSLYKLALEICYHPDLPGCTAPKFS